MESCCWDGNRANGSWNSGRKGGENRRKLFLGASKKRWRLQVGAGAGAGGTQSGTWGGHSSEFPSLGSGDFGILGLAGRILQDNLRI